MNTLQCVTCPFNAASKSTLIYRTWSRLIMWPLLPNTDSAEWMCALCPKSYLQMQRGLAASSLGVFSPRGLFKQESEKSLTPAGLVRANEALLVLLCWRLFGVAVVFTVGLFLRRLEVASVLHAVPHAVTEIDEKTWTGRVWTLVILVYQLYSNRSISVNAEQRSRRHCFICLWLRDSLKFGFTKSLNLLPTSLPFGSVVEYIKWTARVWIPVCSICPFLLYLLDLP